MRFRALAFLLLLAGCGQRTDGNGTVEAVSAPTAAAETVQSPGPVADDGKAECAIGGASEFARICTVERGDSPQGRTMTLRAPDGGFRRLLITRDGRGVIAADGSEPARVTILSPERIEVAIGRDRYRLPAAVAR